MDKRVEIARDVLVHDVSNQDLRSAAVKVLKKFLESSLEDKKEKK